MIEHSEDMVPNATPDDEEGAAREREELENKARQAETAAHIED